MNLDFCKSKAQCLAMHIVCVVYDSTYSSSCFNEIMMIVCHQSLITILIFMPVLSKETARVCDLIYNKLCCSPSVIAIH